MESKYKGIHLVATFALGVIITAGAFLVQAETSQGKIFNKIDINEGTLTIGKEESDSPPIQIDYTITSQNGGKVEMTDAFQERLRLFLESEYEGGELSESKDNDEPSGNIEGSSTGADVLPTSVSIDNYTFSYQILNQDGEELKLTPEARAALACYFGGECNEKSEKMLEGHSSGASILPTSTNSGEETSFGLGDSVFTYSITSENGGKVEFTDEAKAEIACYFSGDCEDDKK